MKIAMKWVSSRIERLIVIVLAASLCGVTPGIAQQTTAQVRHGASKMFLPEAPKPIESETMGGSPEFALAFVGQVSDQSAASAAANSEQQQTSQKPVGTAAAPPEGAAGVTASRPVGAVIAPAKQRRSRAILIRVGLLVGAAVAVGTVLVLTHGTPSQPPQ